MPKVSTYSRVFNKRSCSQVQWQLVLPQLTPHNLNIYHYKNKCFERTFILMCVVVTCMTALVRPLSSYPQLHSVAVTAYLPGTLYFYIE